MFTGPLFKSTLAIQGRRFFSGRSVFKDSIYALSTGFGKSAIAVKLIRLTSP
jgi:ERCC4-related helicase